MGQQRKNILTYSNYIIRMLNELTLVIQQAASAIEQKAKKIF